MRPDQVRDTAHVYGQLAPLGQLKAGRLDFDVASASPTAREGGSPWAGMSGAAVIADNHLVGVITVDPARYAGRLVTVPASVLLADAGFRARLAAHGVRAEAVPVGAGWYLRLPGEQAVSLAPAYQPVSRRFRPALPTLLRPEHGLVPFLGRQLLLDQITGWPQGPDRPVLLVTGGGGSGKTRLGREACVQMLVAGWDAGFAHDQSRARRHGLVAAADAAGGRRRRPARRPDRRPGRATCGGMMLGRRSGCCCWRGPREPGGTGWSASRNWMAPVRSWTWTAIPSRPPAGPSTSAARVSRSPPTATPARSRPTCSRRPSWMIRRTPSRC